MEKSMKKFYLFLLCISFAQSAALAFEPYTVVSPSGVGTMYLQTGNTALNPRDIQDPIRHQADDNTYFSPRENLYPQNDGLMYSQSGNMYIKSGNIIEKY